MPTIRQIAALPYRTRGSAIDAPVSILLVTSRQSGRWVVPRGNEAAASWGRAGKHDRDRLGRRVVDTKDVDLSHVSTVPRAGTLGMAAGPERLSATGRT